MKLWAIGILLFIGSCASSNGDYEIKRFHIQNRHLDGKLQCVEIRRKRSTREADYLKKIDVQQSSSDQVDISTRKKSDADKDGDGDSPAKIVIKHSDLSGSSGILIIQSPSSPNVPLVFAVRPSLTNSNNNKYLKMKIFEDSSFSDDDDDEDVSQYFGDLSDELVDDEFDDYSEDSKGYFLPKIQSSKQSKRKEFLYSQIVEPEKDSMEYKIRPKKYSNKRMSNRSKIMIQVLREQLSQNKKKNNNRNTVQGLRNVKNNDDGSILSPSDCIIIEKEPEVQPTANEKSSAGLLSLDSGDNLPNKGYGLRKRYKGNRGRFE